MRLKTVDQVHSLMKNLSSTTPDEAAKQIINAMFKKRNRILVGNDAVAFDLLVRLFPYNIYNRWIFSISIPLITILVKIINRKTIGYSMILYAIYFFIKKKKSFLN